MRKLFGQLIVASMVCLPMASAALAQGAKPAQVLNQHNSSPAKPHRLLLHVDQNDPAVINLALNNATNVIEFYRAQGEDVDVNIVTYGPGLHMLRADTSPVQDRIKQLKGMALPSKVQFSACGNTKESMEKKGRALDRRAARRDDRSIRRPPVDGEAGRGLELRAAVKSDVRRAAMRSRVDMCMIPAPRRI